MVRLHVFTYAVWLLALISPNSLSDVLFSGGGGQEVWERLTSLAAVSDRFESICRVCS